MTAASSSTASASRPQILSVAKLAPFFMSQLQASFEVHDRLHESDPAAFAKVAPHIRGIAADANVGGTNLRKVPGAKEAAAQVGGIAFTVPSEDWHIQLT